MNEARNSSGTNASKVIAGTRWLLLLHQIPAKPDYLRVKVWRRMQQIGAVTIKNAAWVLPATDAAMEDFQWLMREIDAEGDQQVRERRDLDLLAGVQARADLRRALLLALRQRQQHTVAIRYSSLTDLAALSPSLATRLRWILPVLRALALVLLIVSGLMIQTFLVMRQVQPGFVRPAEVQTFHIALPSALITDRQQVARTYEEIAERNSVRRVRDLVHEWRGHLLIRPEESPWVKGVGACFPT